MRHWQPVLRALIALELLALGVETGARSAFENLDDVGLALGLAAPVAVAVALPGGWWARLPYVAGFSLTIAYFGHQPPAGDVVLQGDWRGYTVLGVAVVLAGFALATLVRVPPRAPAAEAATPSPQEEARPDDPPLPAVTPPDP